MIYAALTLWLFLILFAGIGVYRLWSRLAKPRWLNWLLLPGTVVSEMAYIFGCLITGGEVRHAKLLPGSGKNDPEPQTQTGGGLKYVSPVVASLCSIVACAAAILLLQRLLGGSAFATFQSAGPQPQLPQVLPTTAAAFWNQLEGQVHLLRRMCQMCGRLDWLSWQVPLFVYLAACLSIRIAPVARPVRPTMLAAVAIAALIAAVGSISAGMGEAMTSLWPLLTYVYSSLLLLLTATLLIGGLLHLGRIVLGKEAAPRAGTRPQAA